MSDRLLTAAELAEVLGVSADWIYDQARFHGMPRYKRGNVLRFDADEVKNWMREGTEDEAA